MRCARLIMGRVARELTSGDAMVVGRANGWFGTYGEVGDTCSRELTSSDSGLAMPRSTPPSAQSSAYCTAASAAASVLSSSVTSGSTRVESDTSL
eukprot:6723016-Prymnesium_polylepis.1